MNDITVNAMLEHLSQRFGISVNAITEMLEKHFVLGAINNLLGFCVNMQRYKVTQEQIAHCISAHTGISLEDIRGTSRKREYVQARHQVMYFTKHMTRLSLKTNGEYFDRDHTTVIHSIQTLNDLMDTDKGLMGDMLVIADKIAAHVGAPERLLQAAA